MNLSIGDTRKIIRMCKKHGLLRNQAAYVLATAYWETGRTMKPVREAFYISERFSKAEAWRKRNLRYYPWYGRGHVQLTWERNYKKASRKLGVDFMSDPDKVMKADYSAEILVIGSKEGWFTGKKLSHYITLRKSDFVNARRIINGTDKKHEIAALAKKYDAALLDEDYGVTNHKPLRKSRTIGGGTVAAGGGAAVLVEPISEATDVLLGQQEALSGGSIVSMVVGAIIIAGALYALYARWDDAGKPLPWGD